MKHVLLLTKTMIKSTDLQAIGQKNRKFTIAVMVVAFAYLGFIVGIGSYFVINQLYAMNQPGMSIFLLFSGVSLYLLLMSLLMIPSIYYFSKDIERYLILPITTREFMSARFLNTLYNLYLTLSIVYIPFLIAYTLIMGISVPFTITYLIAGIFLPLIPMMLALIITVLLFNFIPFFKNKNLFTYVTSGLTIGVVLWINMASMNADPDVMMSSILEGLVSGQNSLLNIVTSALPYLTFFVEGVVNSNILYLLIGSVISVLFVGLGIILIQNFYLKSALSVQEEGSSSKKLSTQAMVKKSRTAHVIPALMKYDFKNIIRTPMFAMNYFVMILLVPVMLIFPLFSNDLSAQLPLIQLIIQDILNSTPFLEILMYALFGSYLVAFLFGSMGMMASTAISREGKAMEQFKIMPIKMITIVNAKLLLTTICLMIPLAIVIIVLGIALKINPFIIIVSLIAATIGNFCANIFNITLDVWRPKLDWSNEQEAVKSNFLSVIPLLTILLIGGLLFWMVFQLPFVTALTAGSLVILFVSTLLYFYIKRMCRFHLPSLIA